MRAKWRALKSGCCGVPQKVLDRGDSVRDGRIVAKSSKEAAAAYRRTLVSYRISIAFSLHKETLNPVPSAPDDRWVRDGEYARLSKSGSTVYCRSNLKQRHAVASAAPAC